MCSKVLIEGKVLCATKEYFISYHHGKILVGELTNPQKIKQSLRLAEGLYHFSFFERLMRLGPRCAIPYDEDNILISMDGKIYNYCLSSNTISIEHRYRSGMKNPLSFCGHMKEDGTKVILYGEYFWNTNKESVAIYAKKSGLWEKVYEFPQGTITHVHNVIFDEYRNQYVILTGDEDSESGIWIADLDFSSVNPIFTGMQKYRSCVAFPTKNGLIYATDTPLETNYLYRLNYVDGEKTNIEMIDQIQGPCIFGCRIGDDMYISTTVEPDSTLPTLRYRITRKLGKGVKDRNSYLLRINSQFEISICDVYKKDIMPMWLFQFGNILFPYNETDHLIVSTQSVNPRSGVSYLYQE